LLGSPHGAGCLGRRCGGGRGAWNPRGVEDAGELGSLVLCCPGSQSEGKRRGEASYHSTRNCWGSTKQDWRGEGLPGPYPRSGLPVVEERSWITRQSGPASPPVLSYAGSIPAATSSLSFCRSGWACGKPCGLIIHCPVRDLRVRLPPAPRSKPSTLPVRCVPAQHAYVLARILLCEALRINAQRLRIHLDNLWNDNFGHLGDCTAST
jgi:hypothetical protein